MVKHKKQKPKTTLQKIWHFIWYEDSLLSWAANVLLAFIIIKFIVYPLLSLVFGTSLPVVAVISCSMDQGYTDCGNDVPKNLCGIVGEGPRNSDHFWEICGEYYEERGITKDNFDDFPLSNGFRKGDVIVLKGTDPQRIEVGDVIVFMAQRAYPIIHRVVEINDDQTYQTKGDHNPTQIIDEGLDETSITPKQILGEGFFRIPYVGYVKILAVDALSYVLGR
jgi:hypothetical protein